MSSFSGLEDGRVVSAIASYAVNALWQAPLAAAAAWAVARLLRRAGARAQHRVWVAALLLMVVLPALPRQHWPMNRETATVTMGLDDIDLASLPPMQPAPQPWWTPELGLAMLPRDLMLALLLGYLGAGLYFAARLGWSLSRTRGLVREAVEAEFAPEAERVWERCRKAFALGEVRRLVSGEIACPVTLGRATLLVPEGFLEDASAEELLTALAHECAHLQRRDFWKNVAYELASLPVVFHPALWAVKRQIAETREMVCDGAAVDRVVEPQSYVRSLLRLAGTVVQPAARSAAMGMFDGRTLERRITMMRTRQARMGWMARSASFVVAVTVAAAVLAGGMALAVQVEAKAAPVETKTAAETVAMTQTDAGAGAAPMSIAQLPEVREKAQAEAGVAGQPPADDNVSAAERARREAYANQHFGYGSVAGANSDRGRLYLRYGKPDDVASHPKGDSAATNALGEQTATFPFEVWHYGHLAGVGDNLEMEFVDECNCGEYHAVPMRSGARAFAAGGPLFASLQPMRIDAKGFAQPLSSEQMARVQAQVAELMKQQQDLRLRRQTFSAAEIAKMNQQVKELSAKHSALTPEMMAKLREQMPAWAATQKHSAITAEQMAQQREQMKALTEALQRQQAMLREPGMPIYRGETALAPAAPAAAQQPARPVRISGGVMAADKVSGDGPVYPPIARAAHVQGTVVLHAIISKEGEVGRLEVVSGPQMLQHAAMDAVKTWRYKPYLLNGEPTAVETTISVVFALPAEQGAGSGAETPVRLLGRVVAGGTIGGDEVKYPADAKAAHVQGTVVLHAIISKEGAVEKLEVVSGPEELRSAAMDAVKTWRYRPYLLNGEPTAVETTVTVSFSMNGDEPAAAPRGAQAEPAVYRIGGDVSAPVLVRSVEPEFTEEARKAKLSGDVLVALVVDPEGRPQNVRGVHPANAPQPLGHGLDQKAVDAVKQYVFKPAMRAGRPVPVELAIEVDFKIF